MSGRTIYEVPLVSEVQEGMKFPISDGSNLPQTASVKQINAFITKKVQEFLIEELSSYVKKESGKGLSTNDFTTELKNKLNGLKNYDDSLLVEQMSQIQNMLDSVISGNSSKAIESFNEIVAFLKNIQDNETLEGIVGGISTKISGIETKLSELGSEITDVKYNIFESGTKNQRFIENGYIDSFIKVELGFYKEEGNYYFYFGGLITNEHTINPNAGIKLYKDGVNTYVFTPDTSTPETNRVFTHDSTNSVVVLDITKLNPSFDFSIAENFGLNLSNKCFGHTEKGVVKKNISNLREYIEGIEIKIGLTRTKLAKSEIIDKYVDRSGSLYSSTSYGSYVYNVAGLEGKLHVISGVIDNPYVCVCRLENERGVVLNTLVNTGTGVNEQVVTLTESSAKLYVSIMMAEGVPTTDAIVEQFYSDIVENEKELNSINEDIIKINNKIYVYNKTEITANDKVINSNIVNPLKCYSLSSDNFGTNNAYNYWYTLFKLPAGVKCVVHEKKNTISAGAALVVKVDSLDQFKLNGAYTLLIKGGDADTSSLGSGESYVHNPIMYNVDTYIAVLSNVENVYDNFCYLEFRTETDVTLQDINKRVIKLEGIVVSGTKPYEIVIPDKIYAVVGDTLQIFYDSIFNVQNLANYQVQVLSSKGKAYPRYYEYTPSISDVGNTTIDFNLCEVNDCTTGITKIVATKKVNLVTVLTLGDKIANVLCVGDSTTSGGIWVKELARRFYANDGVPEGLGLTNINICGRKTGTVAGKIYGWEGTGGWTWSTYVSSPVDAIRFNVKDVNSLTMGANYVGSNGAIYEITEINVTNGVGNIRCMYSWDTPNRNELPTSGTLTKRYSTAAGDDTITYTSYESEKFSPFYVNGDVDFTDYANKYCNGNINAIVIHLGINSMLGLKTNLATHLQGIMTTAKKFIDKFHEQFPSGKVLLITPPKCSAIGGMAASYNASESATEEIYNRQMFQYHKEYFELAKDDNYKDWVTIVNTCGEFDTPYGYPYNEKNVNVRVSSKKEMIGTNGVHPDGNGYNMIADSVYRTLTGVL